MPPTNESGVAVPSPAATRLLALDLAHASTVKDELLARTAVGTTTLDLSEVASCDLAGLQLLWAARASARARGQRFTVASPSVAVLTAAVAFGLDLAELQEQP
jgi:anti-sigma B factor antagonist